MHNNKIVLFISILLLSTFACNPLISLPDSNSESPQTIQPTAGSDLPLTEAEVPRVIVEDAKAAFDRGDAIIVDVRSQASYEAGHIAGALFITLGEFESNISNIDLPKNQWIITYCT